ncbi:MAG: MATE family efflux transporter, partial [Woeseiaceae bacterium]|nr:MATE family efflux transporter [Woeseiaceae bacterium]
SCGIAYQVWHLVSGRSRIHLAARHLRLHLAVMVTLARVSLGGVMQFLIVTSSWVIVIRVVASYGTAAVAGFTIALRLMEVVFLPAWGLGNAAATLVGQNLGAKRVERARQSARLATRANVAFMFLVALVFIVAPEILLRPFGDDATVLAVATLCLQVIGIGLPVFAIGLVLTQALNGAGDTDSPMWINLVAFWLIQIPLAYWLANDVGLGAGGVAWAIVISESIMSVMALAVFYRGRWATTAV